MIFLGVQDEDTVLGDFVLEAVDLDHTEDLVLGGWVLDAHCAVVHN